MSRNPIYVNERKKWYIFEIKNKLLRWRPMMASRTDGRERPSKSCRCKVEK